MYLFSLLSVSVIFLCGFFFFLNAVVFILLKNYQSQRVYFLKNVPYKCVGSVG